MNRLFAILALAVIGSGAARAETVEVKYRGPVDLAGFDCQESPQSSLVWRTCYDAKHQYLVVSLKGTYYHYCSMPKGAVSEWRSAPSLGRHYLSSIKGQFDCRSGGVPE